ncbi:unnamed protein product [Effrenium voratum]|nr:unnamed protein product [Effrenium voratum]
MKSTPARRLRTKTSELELFKLQARVNGRVQPSAPAQEKEQLPKPGTLPTPAVQEHKQFSLVEVSSEEGRQAALKCHMGTGTFVREEGFVKERLWNFEVHRCRSLSSDVRSGLPGGRDAARESVHRVAQELGAGGEYERRTGRAVGMAACFSGQWRNCCFGKES